MAVRTDTKRFLEKLFKRFPEYAEKYDYSLCVVDGMSSRITYECRSCGHLVEGQNANDHYQGYACPNCAGNLKHNKKVLVKRSIEKFGNIYDFSITPEFSGKDTKIIIGCPVHGSVETTSGLHLKSVTGCPKCYRYDESEIRDKFYSNQYNADSTLPYLSSELLGKVKLRKVTVRCPHHGEYKIALTSVIAGASCLRCSQQRNIGVYCNTLIERNKAALRNQESGIYLLHLKSEKIDCYKLGVSKNLPYRIKVLSRESGCKISVEFYSETNAYDAVSIEQDILKASYALKYQSPTKFAGCTELISLSDEEVSDLVELLAQLTQVNSDDH